MSDQPKPACPACGAQQHDWLICARCTGFLKADLLRLPGLYADLHTAINGQAKMGSGGKTSDKRLPYEDTKREQDLRSLARYIHNQLATWVEELDMGDTQDLGQNVHAYALWLLGRVERIRSHAAAEEFCTEVEYCCKQARWLVDRPMDLEFCGKCEACGADLYTKPGAVEGICRKCKAAFDPVALRAEVRARLEHHWGTITECARILPTFGLEANVQTIKDWRRPNRHGEVKLIPRGKDQNGHQLYRFGDVMDLAEERMVTRETRRSKARMLQS